MIKRIEDKRKYLETLTELQLEKLLAKFYFETTASFSTADESLTYVQNTLKYDKPTLVSVLAAKIIADIPLV